MVLTVIGVLLSMSAPSFQRASEQAQVDIAAANLRAVWAAQRFYWLEHHQYATNFADLQDLLDPSLSAAAIPFGYTIQQADSSKFQSAATRAGSSKWSGQLVIDQSGAVTGVIQAVGQGDIKPGFQ